jgi:hypothetical protein
MRLAPAAPKLARSVLVRRKRGPVIRRRRGRAGNGESGTSCQERASCVAISRSRSVWRPTKANRATSAPRFGRREDAAGQAVLEVKHANKLGSRRPVGGYRQPAPGRHFSVYGAGQRVVARAPRLSLLPPPVPRSGREPLIPVPVDSVDGEAPPNDLLPVWEPHLTPVRGAPSSTRPTRSKQSRNASTAKRARPTHRSAVGLSHPHGSD